jgi:LmbE family N-acetylglucosaminyl deacetylase
LLRLLALTAHPDDEAGGFGGSLVLYAQRGVQTHIVCLTPGQAASNRGGAGSDDELAAMRRKEFANACKILGIAQGEVLDFPDGKLDRTDFYKMAEQVTRRVRKIRPHVMLTFGTEGAITSHPDHSMASLVGTMAFHWAGRTNRFPEHFEHGLQPWRTQKLYYSTWPGFLPDRQPISLAPWTASIEVGEEAFQTKLNAFKAHTSQNPLYDLFEKNVCRFGTTELFHLAATVEPGQMKYETDLFDGVTDHDPA